MQIAPIEGGALLGGLNWPTDPTQEAGQRQSQPASKTAKSEKKDTDEVEDELQKLVMAGKILPSDAAAIFDRAIQAKKALEADPTILASNPQKAKKLLEMSNVSSREISQALLAKSNYDQIRTHSEKSGSYDNFVGQGSGLYVHTEEGFKFIDASQYDENKHRRVKVGEVLDMRAQNQPLADQLLTMVQGAKGLPDIQKEINDAFTQVAGEYTGSSSIKGDKMELIKEKLKTNRSQRAAFAQNMWMRLDGNSKNYFYQQAVSHGAKGDKVHQAAQTLMMDDYLSAFTYDDMSSETLIKDGKKVSGDGDKSGDWEKSKLGTLLFGTSETGMKINTGHEIPMVLTQVGSAPAIDDKGERISGFFTVDNRAFRQNSDGELVEKTMVNSITATVNTPWSTLDGNQAISGKGADTASSVAFRSTGNDDVKSFAVPKGVNPAHFYKKLNDMAIAIINRKPINTSGLPKYISDSAEFKQAVEKAKSGDVKMALNLLTSTVNELTHVALQNNGEAVDVYALTYLYKTDKALKAGGNDMKLWDKVDDSDRDVFHQQVLGGNYSNFNPWDEDVYKALAFAKLDRSKLINFEGGTFRPKEAGRHPEVNQTKITVNPQFSDL